MKIALFQPVLPHYRLPVFQELSKQKEIDLTIFYGTSKSVSNVAPEKIKSHQLNTWVFQFFGEPIFIVWKWLFVGLLGDYDVFVFTWDPHYLFLVPALLLARLRGKGTVLWGHGYSKSNVSWKKRIRLFIGKLADVIVLYNHSAAKELIREGFDPKRVFVAPNTQDQSDIQKAREYWLSRASRLNEFKRRNGLSPQNTVLFCSRLEVANHVDWLISAHAQLLKNNPDYRLVIIGQGSEEKSLKKQVLDLGVGNSVVFLGPIYDQNQLAPWFLSAGVFCYPRNIGLSILHAFGYGLPVVTSDKISSHNPEIEALRDGENGLLFQDENIEDLARKIKQVLKKKSIRRKLENEARRTALEDYTVKGMVDGLKNSFVSAAKHQEIWRNPEVVFPLTKKKRLAILVDRIAPYHDARLQALSTSFDIFCIETCERSNPDEEVILKKKTKYKKLVLFPDSNYTHFASKVIVEKVNEALDAIHPSVVAIPGWGGKIPLSALLWCIKNNIPKILMSDSTEQDFRRYFLKEFVKSKIIGFFDSAIAGGVRQVDYLIKLKFLKTKIYTGYDVVDNDYFTHGSNDARRKAPTLRRRINLPENYFLASSRFISKKNIRSLIQGYAAYMKNNKKPWNLVLLGDGPEWEMLTSMVKQLGLDTFVYMPGFVQYDQLPIYYGLASVFILASISEQWGLVVNEAMASGLPVIISNRCGCVQDLVHENMNGWTFEPTDTEALSNLMSKMSSFPARQRNLMGKQSVKIIGRYNLKTFTKSIKDAELQASTAKRVSSLDRRFLELTTRFIGNPVN